MTCPSESFNPRSPCGERRCSPSPPRGTARFNPRSPCGERRATEKKRENLGSFQPTLPLRGATTPAPPSPEARVFQPTLPLRGATATGAPARRWSSSFNPRSPCGERRSSRPSTSPSASFNPRSPCGERRWRDLHQALLQRVSTHAPLAGSDGYSCSRPRLSSLFQPTLPLRGATGHGRRRHQEADVSTHAPLAGSDGPHLELLNVVLVVSTHAPLAGSDPRTFRCRSRQACFNPRSPCGERLFGFLLLVCLDEFQPTLPLRGATPWRWHRKSSARVSTHAPLAGSDASTRARSGAVRCFNPRSPCGERPTNRAIIALCPPFQPTLPLRGATSATKKDVKAAEFQPTLPLRGATLKRLRKSPTTLFQPTLPLRGATVHIIHTKTDKGGFNPRSPCGERLDNGIAKIRPDGFNPRSPCGERLEYGDEYEVVHQVSTHAPLAGSDVQLGARYCTSVTFQPTLPLRGATWP